MSIQASIDELKKELNKTLNESSSIMDFIFKIQDTFPNVPALPEEAKAHPATKYFFDALEEKKRKADKIISAIEALEAILK